MPDFPTSDPQGARSTDPAEAERRRQAALEEELEAARLKRDRYQALLKELPEVFEGKFQERVRPLQQRHQQLIEEGEALREQIRRSLPAAPGGPQAALAPAATPPAPAGPSGAPWRWRAVAAGAAAATLLLLAGRLLLPGPALQTSTSPTPGRSEPAAASIPPTPPATEAGTVQPSSPRMTSEVPVPRGMLRIRTSGPSWIEVKSADGALLFTGELNGQRQFPFGRGLRIRSGRADLVAIQMADQPERPLGAVEIVDWQRFSPPASPSP